MKLLLDTHVLLWWLNGDERLNDVARKQISNPDNRIYVSAATIWEAGIKQQLGKLELPESLVDLLGEEGFHELSISAAHAQQAANLPIHHRDPFDRMLIAQAILEELVLVTHDKAMDAYDVEQLAI